MSDLRELLCLCLCLMLVVGSAPASSIHFFAIPKTASSTAREVLKASPCFKGSVHPVQHRFCNGSAPRWSSTVTVATIREPCERFRSMVRHLHRENPNGMHGSGNASELLAFVGAAAERCSDDHGRGGNGGNSESSESSDDNCLVREMAAAEAVRRKSTHERTQIPLFPQSFMVAPSTHIVCYSKDHFQSQFVDELFQLTDCRRDALNGSSARIETQDIRRNDHPHGSDDPAAGAAVGNASSSSLSEGDEVCAAVRRLYPRDVELWERHCVKNGTALASARPAHR